MQKYVDAEEFLNLAQHHTIIDVRSPVEFDKGHIPGAANVPLFSDSERARIGVLYRQQGRVDSVLTALEIVGPRMHDLAKKGLELASGKAVLIHCWRGGMRSAAVAWLLQQVNLKTVVLQGGYKAYRRHVLQSFKLPVPLVVLSGLTGAGKTVQLQALKQSAEQVIDLEQLANHRGSAFGGIGQGTQPTVEQFENELSNQIANLNTARRIWVEDESRNVGSIKIPHHFFEQMRTAPAVFMEVDRRQRVRNIRQEYGDHHPDDLKEAMQRITKRLGGQNVKAASTALDQNDFDTAISILLDYYDRTYLINKQKLTRRLFVYVDCAEPLSTETTGAIIRTAENNAEVTSRLNLTPPAKQSANYSQRQ